jgi:hypothetical protein
MVKKISKKRKLKIKKKVKKSSRVGTKVVNTIDFLTWVPWDF